MIELLTVVYLGCFQAAAVPSIVRIWRRQSSADLSVWREWLVLTGIAVQLVVFWSLDAHWLVLISPIASAVSLGTLLSVIYWHR